MKSPKPYELLLPGHILLTAFSENRVNGHAKRLAFPFVRSKRLIGKAKIQQSLNGRKSDVSKYTADAIRKAPNITRNLMSVKKGF